MDWKDELKSQASDKAQSKAVDSVTKSHGDTASSLANDGIDAAKAGDPKILAQKQKLAAQQRAREVAERKYAEGKTSAANKVADQYGNTAGKATSDAIDAARNGDMQGFENQQKENAKDRTQDTAARKLEEQLSGNSVAKAQQAATMSAEEKRDLLKDMDISYTSKQTQTQEELLAASSAAKSMSVDDKRELLKDMEISYTSKPVPVQEQSTNATASPGQNASASIASQATANTQNTSPHNSQNQPQSSSAAETEKPKGPVQQKAPIAIGALNTLVIKLPITIEVETFYDLSLQETWDDQCILWTTADDGATYKQSYDLTDSSKVMYFNKRLRIYFERVEPYKNYSCAIDQGNDQAIILFQNFKITPDMAIQKREF